MDYEWSDIKAASNLKKHGVDFEDAIFIFDGFVLIEKDDRFDYGETRFVAFGMWDGRVLAVVFTDRNDVRRIISARKANPNERRAYHQAHARWAPPET